MQAVHIGIVGAGSIGCFMAAVLAQQANIKVTLVARSHQLGSLQTSGISARWPQGTTQQHHVEVTDSAVSLTDCDLIVIAVKATALEPTLRELKDLIPSRPPLLLVQNGVGIRELAATVVNNSLYRAVVPYNVVQVQPGVFEQTSAGILCLEQSSLPVIKQLADAFEQGPGVQQFPDIHTVEYGKLLLNLNNALNALSDIPLKDQLETYEWRRILAAAMREWLLICKRSHIKPFKMTNVSPRLIPWLLDLPDWIFLRIAAAMLQVDPKARLSMWYDFVADKPTEIDFLNGAVVRLGQQHQVPTPVNQWIYDQITKRRYDPQQVLDPRVCCRLLGL